MDDTSAPGVPPGAGDPAGNIAPGAVNVSTVRGPGARRVVGSPCVVPPDTV